LIFFILAFAHIVCAQSLPASPQQPTNIPKSPTEVFIPILVAVITGFSVVFAAYLSGLFVKRSEFNLTFETTLKSVLIKDEILNIIHQMRGFLTKDELEESLRNLIMTKPELVRSVLNSLMLLLIEEKKIDQMKSYIESEPSRIMSMSPGDKKKFINKTFQQLATLLEEEK